MDHIANHERITNLIIKRETERQLDVKKKRDEKKLISAENEQHEIFSQTFQDRVKNIETLLKSAHDVEQSEITYHFDRINKEIRAIQKFVSDSILFIRGYDMRVSQETLQDLELQAQKLEEKLLPKKKFGFKNKRAVKKFEESKVADHVDGSKKLYLPDNFFGFKNKANENLVLEAGSLHKKDVMLQNLTGCVVKLLGSPSTLHVSNVTDCLIITGPVSTSVFAENCLNCKLVLACQQLRLHSSVDCDIYLHVTSRAIIEDSHDIKVAPYNLSYARIAEDFLRAGLDRSTNNWDSLDDFNWLVADKHSPNWSVLDESNFVADWESYAEMKLFNICIDH